MEGKFYKRLPAGKFYILCGLVLIGFAVYNTITHGTSPSYYILAAFGTIAAVSGLFMFLANNKAFLRVDDGHLQANYHWFGKLDCSLSEVAFALPQMNTLTVILKNGKRHTIAGIENSWAVARYIREKTFSLERESPDALRKQLAQFTAKRRTWFLLFFGFLLLIFANIFIAVFLTGGRDVGEFLPSDYPILATMGGVELLTLAGLFWVASKAGLLLWPIEQTKFRLKNALIASQPLPPGNIRYVYTDPDLYSRIVIYGFPAEPDVFFTVEKFTKDLDLKLSSESKLFPDEQSLFEEVEVSIDITHRFL